MSLAMVIAFYQFWKKYEPQSLMIYVILEFSQDVNNTTYYDPP